MDPPLAHGLEKFHSWCFLKIRMPVFVVPFLKGERECLSSTTRVWTEFRVGAISLDVQLKPECWNSAWWDFQHPLSKVLKTVMWHPPRWSLSFAKVPSQKKTIRSEIILKNQLRVTGWWQVDIKGHWPSFFGGCLIEQKSFISKMSLTAVSKYNKQGRALLANATTAL